MKKIKKKQTVGAAGIPARDSYGLLFLIHHGTITFLPLATYTPLWSGMMRLPSTVP